MNVVTSPASLGWGDGSVIKTRLTIKGIRRFFLYSSWASPPPSGVSYVLLLSAYESHIFSPGDKEKGDLFFTFKWRKYNSLIKYVCLGSFLFSLNSGTFDYMALYRTNKLTPLGLENMKKWLTVLTLQKYLIYQGSMHARACGGSGGEGEGEKQGDRDR